MTNKNRLEIKFNQVEKEVIILKAILDLINNMVNHQVFKLLGEDPDCNISFYTEIHQRLFSIVLADFLSETDKGTIGSQKTYLEFLKQTLKNPSFGTNNSVEHLRTAIDNFAIWLKQEIRFEDVWFPSLGMETNLILTREDFLKLCGTISKHNFTRLSSVRNKICEYLNKGGVKTTPEVASLALGDFYEHFYENIFTYHGSTLAEMLNEIRWGIQEYLQKEYKHHKAKYKEIPKGQKYQFPPKIKNPLAQFCFMELMYHLEIGPYFRRFRVWKYLKLRY